MARSVAFEGSYPTILDMEALVDSIDRVLAGRHLPEEQRNMLERARAQAEREIEERRRPH